MPYVKGPHPDWAPETKEALDNRNDPDFLENARNIERGLRQDVHPADALEAFQPHGPNPALDSGIG